MVDVRRDESVTHGLYSSWSYEISVYESYIELFVQETMWSEYLARVNAEYGSTYPYIRNGSTPATSFTINIPRQKAINKITLSGVNTSGQSIIFDPTGNKTTTFDIEFTQPNTAPTAAFDTLPNLYAGKPAIISWTTSDEDGDSVLITKLVRYAKTSGASSYTSETLINSSGGVSETSYTDTIPESAGEGLVYYELTVTDGVVSKTFTSGTKSVLDNEPPVISGSDGNIGTFALTAPTHTYSISDPDGGTVSVTVTIDGKTHQQFTASLDTEYSVTFTDLEWLKTLNGSHTIVITATDPKGATDTRTLTFTKNVTVLVFTLEKPLDADAQITKCIETLTASVPEGASITIEVCNNAYDASPTWEDVTQEVLNREKIFFENTTKTAANWGYNVRVTIERNNATGECWAFSMAGYFE